MKTNKKVIKKTISSEELYTEINGKRHGRYERRNILEIKCDEITSENVIEINSQSSQIWKLQLVQLGHYHHGNTRGLQRNYPVNDLEKDIPQAMRVKNIPPQNTGTGNKSKQNTSNKIKHETLFDIWINTKKNYDNVISALTNEYEPIGMPFVEITDGKPDWIYKGNGFVQYLHAFVFTCYKKGFLKKGGLSAPQYQKLLSNTFNLHNFDIKLFQSFPAKEPSTKYRKPFLCIYPE